MNNFEINSFNKTQEINNVLSSIDNLMEDKNKFSVLKRVIHKKVEEKTSFQKLKNTNVSLFNKFKFFIYNANRDELLQELKQSLELYDISSSSINYIYLEKTNESIVILISKKSNIGQSNASVTNIKPKVKYLTMMYKITPISLHN